MAKNKFKYYNNKSKLINNNQIIKLNKILRTNNPYYNNNNFKIIAIKIIIKKQFNNYY